MTQNLRSMKVKKSPKNCNTTKKACHTTHECVHTIKKGIDVSIASKVSPTCFLEGKLKKQCVFRVFPDLVILLSCLVLDVACLVLCCLVVSSTYLVLPCCVLSCRVLRSLLVSCRVSCGVLSCLVLSCIVYVQRIFLSCLV